MKNVAKGADKALEVVEPKNEKLPTPEVVDVPTQEMNLDEVEKEFQNTLKYVNAVYSLLNDGLFPGKSSNDLIQVKAWLENQQKFLSIELAKVITQKNTLPKKGK